MPQKKILMISPTPSHPQTAGNRARIFSLLDSIKSLGHDVHFLFLNREHGDIKAMQQYWGDNFLLIPYKHPSSRAKAFARKLKKYFGLKSAYTYKIDEWYDPSQDDDLKKILDNIQFDVVIVEYIFFSRALLQCNANTIKIIDTHDVFTDRHLRYLQQSQVPTWYSTSKKQEAKGLNRADVIIAIQDHEAEHFKRISNKKVITIGHMVPLCKLPINKAKPHRALYVGSNNDINVQSVHYLIDKILPLVWKTSPQVELLLAGRICNAVKETKGIVLAGEVNDLTKIYESASLVLNPMRFGTGLKIKTIEALGYGKPLITTSAGAEGLEKGAGKAFLVEDKENDFASSMIELLNNPKRLREISKEAYQFAESWNKECVNELDELLKGTSINS